MLGGSLFLSDRQDSIPDLFGSKCALFKKFDNASNYTYLLTWLLLACTTVCSKMTHASLNNTLDLPLRYLVLTRAFIHVYSKDHLVYIF